VTGVVFGPDGARLATGSADHTARLWDARTGVALLEVMGHTDAVTSIVFSPDGARLATGCADHTARLWDTRTGAALLELKGHTNAVTSVAFSPDGTRLATGSDDRTAWLWDAATGGRLLEFNGNTGAVTSVAFSPDGTRLATGSDDHSARLWNTGTGAPLADFKGHTGTVTGVSFNPDGTRLATGCGDHMVRLWDARTGAAVLELKGHKSTVTRVVFSPDGTRLASGGHDGTARLWDARTGAGLLELRGQTKAVASLVFSPDGSRLATGNEEGTVRLWDARADSRLGERERTDSLELDTRLWATRFDDSWHSEQMARWSKGQDADWFAAVYHANQLSERQPGNEALLAGRQAIVAAAVEREPKEAAALAAHARLLLDAGKLDDYRKTCAALADLAGDFKDEVSLRRLAATCVLAPEPLKDLQPLLDAFKKTMSDKYPEDLRMYGGLLLRAGKVEVAVRFLLRARNDQSGTPFEDLLLAIAYHQLREPDEAKKYVDRAILALDRQPAEAATFNLQAGCLSPVHAVIGAQLSLLPDPRERAVGWKGWIDLQVLRREAGNAAP
jgi:dipeptidyl aminopeptidase/acylaminoacyl peptidase